MLHNRPSTSAAAQPDAAQALRIALKRALRRCDDPKVRRWIRALMRGETAASRGVQRG